MPMDDPFAVDAPPVELAIRSYNASDELIEHLLAHLTTWDAAGRPGVEQIPIRAYPVNRAVPPTSDTIDIRKQWTQLMLDWSTGLGTEPKAGEYGCEQGCT